MPFGKYKGIELTKIYNTEYLKFIGEFVSLKPELRRAINDEVNRRKESKSTLRFTPRTINEKKR